MPSSRPASKPSAFSRRCNSLTSSPRNIGACEIEQAVAERVAALDERAPGLAPADTVDAQSASSLELAHCRERLVAEEAIESDRTATLRETLLEVSDGVTPVADA